MSKRSSNPSPAASTLRVNIDQLGRRSAAISRRISRRTSPFLTHPVFNRYHSETEMLRYISACMSRDLSLAHSMIPLGSCTMKLNATSEMLPVTWPRVWPAASVRPRRSDARAIARCSPQLENWLAKITGFAAVSLQPNAGSQGEYAGLLVDPRLSRIAAARRTANVCLIPVSAHGTNPASAVVAGMKVVPVACDERATSTSPI